MREHVFLQLQTPPYQVHEHIHRPIPSGPEMQANTLKKQPDQKPNHPPGEKP